MIFITDDVSSKTIRMSRKCDYCGLGFTYRSEEKLAKANQEKSHYCPVCRRIVKKNKKIK